jgi:peptide/nickel transport system substrate-binding protein
MNRRQFMQTAAATLAVPSLGRAQAASTLKFVPYADLALLDPLVSSFATRNHVLMVFDTLYGLDDKARPQPQMVEGHTVEEDGRRWRLTLRPGLKFHDGEPVLARDVVPSLRRWASGDSFGDALLAATDELSAPFDRVVEFRLKRPFPLLPDALAKPTNQVAAIMPARLAATPSTTRLTEMVGSGPFRYVASERVPGARNVWRKFADYLPREGTPNFTAGARIAHFEQVEWLTIPDPGTAVAALQSGEVDWVEQPLMDLVPVLRRDRNLALQVVENTGLIGFLRFNALHPPFDKPAVRRVLLKTVRQRDYMSAVVAGDASLIDDKVGIFGTGTPSANDAGMEIFSGPVDLPALKRELAAAGYQGEKIVFLAATDVPRINAICEVGAQACRDLGMNVDYQQTDWGTVVQRFPSRAPIAQGGWNIFCAYNGGYDFFSPAGHLPLRGTGPRGWIGWPTSEKLEALRTAWLETPDPAAQAAIARDIQLQAFRDAPYLPLGAYSQPTAYRRNLTSMLTGLPLFWNIRRA